MEKSWLACTFQLLTQTGWPCASLSNSHILLATAGAGDGGGGVGTSGGGIGGGSFVFPAGGVPVTRRDRSPAARRRSEFPGDP